MKYRDIILAAALLFAACSPQTGTGIDSTETASYSDSTKYLQFELNAEWPSGQSAIAEAVRSTLLDVLHARTVSLGFNENAASIPKSDKTAACLDSVVAYYGAEAVKNLKALAEEDAKARIESGSDADDFPGYECSCELKRIGVTEKYWVYQSSDYVYLGGAHGGVTGAGYLTFSKKDGTLLTGMIVPSGLLEMQPLLKKGLVQYFAECEDPITEAELCDRLFLEDKDGIIPLPAYEPYPTENGLVFVYQQYEIAPYAAGMPSFTIPFEEVKPFLSEEATDLLF